MLFHRSPTSRTSLKMITESVSDHSVRVTCSRQRSRLFAAATGMVCAAVVAGASAVSAAATASSIPISAASHSHAIRPVPPGALTQLPGASGCLVDRSTPRPGCASVRALRGPAPFLGSNAIAISADGRDVYVASSTSDAIAVFRRNTRTGRLNQARGDAGCIAARGAAGCARAVGLEGPTSVAISPDGRNVYATSVTSDSITIFRRNPKTGALAQPTDSTGCIAALATPRCATARALRAPDVVAVSPDGTSVYVGSFDGNAILVFARSPSSGTLRQLAGSAGCLAEQPIAGCAIGLAMAAPEGIAISSDGKNAYVAAAGSSALDALARDPSTGALTQATDGSGCIANSPLSGCSIGRQLAGADAVTVSPDGQDVYTTAALSNSVASFARTASTGQLAQPVGTTGCAIYVLAVACSLGRTLIDPEGLAVSPDGANVYTAAFASGAIDVLARNASGELMQEPRRWGCVTSHRTPTCVLARGLLGVSSLAVSRDGKYLYSAAFNSNAIDVFKRHTRG